MAGRKRKNDGSALGRPDTEPETRQPSLSSQNNESQVRLSCGGMPKWSKAHVPHQIRNIYKPLTITVFTHC
jgi:hypothetical protein